MTRSTVLDASMEFGNEKSPLRSMYDSLTSLPNRSAFYARLERALDVFHPPHQTVIVVFLDIDDFKSLNATFGRQIGDEVLRMAAARLTQLIPAQDMVSRLSNDEFGCVIISTPIPEQSSSITRALSAAVSAPMRIGALEFAVHASIGVAINVNGDATASAMMERAASAMYRAKFNGTGYTFFENRIASTESGVVAGSVQSRWVL